MDLGETLLGFEEMPVTWTEKEKHEKDSRASSFIKIHLADHILLDVLNEKTTAELWLKLKQLCMPSKLNLKHQLYSHYLVEGVSVSEHISKYRELVGDLKFLEVNYDEEDLKIILLCSLPLSYMTFKDNVLYRLDTLALDDMYGLLSSREKREQKQIASYLEPKVKGKFCCLCMKKGHAMDECYKLQNEDDAIANGKGKRPMRSGGADINPKLTKKWILGSEYPFHVCHNRGLFKTYEDVDSDSLLIANNSRRKIVGVGTVKIRMFNGAIRMFQNVKYVPDLKRNIISLSILDEKGCRFVGEDGGIEVSHRGVVIMRAHRKASTNLYVVHGNTVFD